MLPKPYRMIRRDDFTATVKKGGRVGRKTLVIHARELIISSGTADIASVGGPLFGLVITKQVGNAVVRHHIARKLRHICAAIIPELNSSIRIVIRVLPSAASASSEVLEKDLRVGLRKLDFLATVARDEHSYVS
ncbi:MAG: ribonuclease P protein component [Mycobacteriaceae bacterium]